ncbi:MAG: HtaA domain-containing protein [Solirubrobacterales bacterium]
MLTDSQNSTGPATFGWGFKSSFRSYINFVAGGSLHALDGATRESPSPTAGFTFSVADGSFSDNGNDDPADDKAIISGTGTALFCGTGHGFRVALSNPTVVIDGDNSRLVVDIDTNLSGVWTPSQRIDLADLDLDAAQATYNKSGAEITWNSIPTALSTEAAGLIPGYAAGVSLDPITVGVNVAEGSGFPLPASCTLTQTAGMAAYPDTPGRPAALPALATPVTATGGRLDWGIRSGLRGTMSSPGGQFNVSGGATRSDPVTMAGAGKFFTWPSSAASYDAGAAGDADDSLVLHGSGSVGLCQTAHGYGTVISDPSVVIDGANSRVTAGVATRVGPQWIRARVDLVKFDSAGATVSKVPGTGNQTISWTLADPAGTPAVGPVTLTADGQDVLNPLSAATYVEGAAFQGLTVSVVVPE